MKEREDMIRDLWERIDPTWHNLNRFSDGTLCYFLKHIKIEKDGDKIEMYNTTSDLYNIIPDSSVWYAHTNSLEHLSISMIATRASERLIGTKYNMLEQTINKLKKDVQDAEQLNIPNLTKIKEDYESKQREDCEAIQEV